LDDGKLVGKSCDRCCRLLQVILVTCVAGCCRWWLCDMCCRLLQVIDIHYRFQSVSLIEDSLISSSSSSSGSNTPSPVVKYRKCVMQCI